jgi:hypothetical protein
LALTNVLIRMLENDSNAFSVARKKQLFSIYKEYLDSILEGNGNKDYILADKYFKIISSVDDN